MAPDECVTVGSRVVEVIPQFVNELESHIIPKLLHKVLFDVVREL